MHFSWDAARTRAPSQATLYKTSSIAKLIIAVAVMQQVDGLVGAGSVLNATIRQWLVQQLR